jgi:major membrane immunogen (membrane-anchored lipoprotein)
MLGNWKNFREVDVRVPDRLFLVGANASGKSNFMDALRFLKGVAIGGGLKEAVRLRGGGVLLKNWAAPAHEPIYIQVEVVDENKFWTYSLSFVVTQDTSEMTEREVDMVQVVYEYASCDGQVLLSLPDDESYRSSKRSTYAALSTNRFRSYAHSLVEFLDSVTSEYDCVKVFSEIGAPSMGPLESKLELIEEAFRELVPNFKPLTALLRSIKDKNYFGSGGPFFSKGTYQLFGLLWEALTGKGTLLLENPESYLHQTVVEKLPFVLRKLNTDRQLIISTHSPRLLQDEGIGLNEVLVFIPSAVESVTRVVPASKLENVRALVEGGHTIGEAVMPITE